MTIASSSSCRCACSGQVARLPLREFTATDFRCLRAAELAANPQFNLIHGANASGKTSLLEAIAYLGRGKSFRGAPAQNLVRHGTREFLLLGRVDAGSRIATVGVRNSREGLEVRIDGQGGGGAAALAAVLPLQVLDPDVHNLVSGGPEQRRRYLDWIAFHVEHGYLELWRRFRRALKQRNAALREDAGPAELKGWDREFCETGLSLHAAREQVLVLARPALEEMGAALLRSELGFEYQRGWAAERSLLEALQGSLERDRQLGSTQCGPQRADLKLIYDERQASKLVSRGQQKLLASTLILAAVEVVQAALEKPLLLLLDDPAAELDSDSLERLMASVVGLGCQVIATSLTPDRGLFPDAPALFHVEQGALKKQD